MSLFQDPRRQARFFALLAIVVLFTGLAAAWWNSRPARPPAPGRPPDVNLDPAEGVIHDALREAGADSAAIRMRWVDEVPGFDLAGLDPERREIFVRFANAERCTCGCGYTLAGCRTYDSSCEVSAPRVQALLDSVRAGRIRSAAGIRKRPA